MFEGLDHQDTVLLLNRLAVGLFFAISGYHKLFVRERHEQLVLTLEACGIPFVWFCQWFVPLVEFFGGLAVLSGILAPFAALGMLVILLIALSTDGPKRIREYKPIDRADYLDDFLYLPETTYVVMLLFVIFLGPGRYSLHWRLVHYIPGF
jgi:putative oxidoreductase